MKRDHLSMKKVVKNLLWLRAPIAVSSRTAAAYMYR